MAYRFLLIDDSRNAINRQSSLHVALKNLGTINIATSKDIAKALKRYYDLVIIDTVAIEDPVRLINDLHAIKEDLWITVTANTPTWQEARAVFHAGAIDYYERLQETKQLTDAIRYTLVVIR